MFQTGSPIKYHTRLMEMHDFLDRNTFRPEFDFPNEDESLLQVGGVGRGLLSSPAAGNVVNLYGNISITDKQTGDAFMAFLRGQQEQLAQARFG